MGHRQDTRHQKELSNPIRSVVATVVNKNRDRVLFVANLGFCIQQLTTNLFPGKWVVDSVWYCNLSFWLIRRTPIACKKHILTLKNQIRGRQNQVFQLLKFCLSPFVMFVIFNNRKYSFRHFSVVSDSPKMIHLGKFAFSAEILGSGDPVSDF